MEHDVYLEITGQYVELDTLLSRLRELQDKRMLAADTTGRADLGEACQLIERTKGRLFAAIECIEQVHEELG